MKYLSFLVENLEFKGWPIYPIVMQKREINIALVQMAMSEDPEDNLSYAVDKIRLAATRGADIICLPELFRSPYFCLTPIPKRDYREELPGKVGQSLSSLAKECKVIIVAGSIYESASKLGYNTALIYAADGEELGRYRKIHIPHDPGFYEQDYFIPGDLGYCVVETKVRGVLFKIGVLICYDQWFPEAARTLALKGADIIFYPTAIGTVDSLPQVEGSWQDAWRNVQRGHAIANNVVVAAVNRVGKEHQSTFWGGSFVCDAFGRILSEGSNREELIFATIDLEHNKHVRDSWRFFNERRPDTYHTIISSK